MKVLEMRDKISEKLRGVCIKLPIYQLLSALMNQTFVDHLCYFCLVLLCFHARLFVDAFWAGKGLTS